MSIFTSIVIITRNRPEMLKRCLDALKCHSPSLSQIVVVDASDDTQTLDIVSKFDGITLVPFLRGANRMPDSRNLGLKVVNESIVVFIDDDSMVHKDWLAHLLEPFNNPDVGCVGGGIFEPGTLWNTDEPIGRVLPDGNLTQNFSPDHKDVAEVDHVKGCNMAFRRDLLESIGGYDSGYIGDNVREETDVCLGIKRLGKKVVFCPQAIVTHARAPREGVTRNEADPRKLFYNSRNHTYLIIKYYPNDGRKVMNTLFAGGWGQFRSLRPNRQLPYRLWLLFATVAGSITGLLAALTSRRVWAMWRLGR